MGYPLAVGVVTGLARRQAALDAKAANFGQYSQRFTEHAAAYRDQDLQGAREYDAPAATMLDLGGPATSRYPRDASSAPKSTPAASDAPNSCPAA